MKIISNIQKKQDSTLISCRINKDLYSLVKKRLNNNNTTITSLINAAFKTYVEETNEQKTISKAKK